LQDHFVMIDSATRTNGTDSDYSVEFPMWREVVELELLQASIPNSMHTVAGTLVFSEGGSDITATVPSGIYTATELGVAVSAAMNTVAALQRYVVSIDKATQAMTLAVQTPLTRTVFEVKGGTVLPFLGLVPASGATTYTGGAVNVTPHPYIFLHVTNIPTRVVGMGGAQGCFLPIFFDERPRKLFTSSNDMQYVVTFSPPLDLSHLDISWKTWDGQPVQFHGQSHQLVVRISTWTGSVRPQPRSHVLEIPRLDIHPDLARGN